MRLRLVVPAACWMLLACTPSPSPVAERPVAVASAAPAAPGGGSAPSATAVATAAEPSTAAAAVGCGELECRLYDSPEDAFREVLKRRPQVLGIGETHAQKGSEGVLSATKRFTEQLLPLMAAQASDLILELWVADGRCGKQTEKKVATQQKQVTEKQAQDNQNEFVTLGDKAVSLGIKPHVLRPACDDYERIASAAGQQDIALMLSMITRLTSQKIKDSIKRNESAGTEKMVIAYGGAIHNDLAPQPGREEWSYGPEMSAMTQGRYVEIDLIVPQYIQDNPSWRGLAWFPYFDRDKHPDKTTLYQPKPGSYVLIFPSR